MVLIKNIYREINDSDNHVLSKTIYELITKTLSVCYNYKKNISNIFTFNYEKTNFYKLFKYNTKFNY